MKKYYVTWHEVYRRVELLKSRVALGSDLKYY